MGKMKSIQHELGLLEKSVTTKIRLPNPYTRKIKHKKDLTLSL